MTRAQTTGLRSRVSQRLFLLFLLAALVPTAGLALIAYQQVSVLLIELNHRRLQQDAKALGMGLIQRLSWREEALHHHGAQPTQAGQAAEETGLDADAPAGTPLGPLEVVSAESLVNLSGTQMHHLRRGKVLLQLSTAGEATLTRAFGQTATFLVSRLDPAGLWEDEYAGESYCFLTLVGRPLYCSTGMPVPDIAAWADIDTEDRNAGVFDWTVAGEEHLAAYWRIPLQASLGHEGLLVVVSHPRKDALAVLMQFQRVFPAIVLLAMGLAAWLAISQIRRQMRPLEELEQHTWRLSQGDFSEQVEIPGDDEFARLGKSFNRMSANLNQQFHLLRALGEIDRAILSTSEMEAIIRLLLAHVPAAVSCDFSVVARFEGSGRLVVWTRGADPRQPGEIHPLDQGPLNLPDDGTQAWFELDLSQSATPGLSFLAMQGATRALVFPARVGSRCDSALLLAYRQLPADLEDITRAARSLADRLAAAAFSIAWEDKLYRQAHFDALTDLPNRTLLRDRVEQALLRASREKGLVALMLIDLDKFKDVNDSLGHSAGDELLVSCARRLRAVARHTDTVARLGGDEFVILLPDLPPAGAAAIVDRVATEVCAELANPIEIAHRSISASASIGIALYPDNGTEIEELLKNADAAMYESKRDRRGGYQFYSSQMNLEIKVRFEMAQDLRKALDNDEFFLVYQPKIAAANGHVVGAEALIRWASPRLGLVSPLHFMPMIDDIGLGSRLGQWVIDAACAQMKTWEAQGLPPLRVSVNASPSQFRSAAIVDQVRGALTMNRLAADRLELEILESMAVDASAGISETLDALRQLGIGIALDDFGTGYSSLVYLTQLPATVLKIDRGFITDMLDDPRKHAIVERIISLAKVLDYEVVAEGVETAAQADALRAMGCDVFQGFYFSKPLKPDDFRAFAQARGAVS